MSGRLGFRQNFVFRFTAFLLVITFSLESALWASPEIPFRDIRIPPPDFVSPERFRIPSELGSIQAFYTPDPNSVSSRRPFIIHIQDAHAHPEAQSKIREILHFLNRRYRVSFVGVEGAVGKLKPGLLDLFPGYLKVNQAIAEELAEKGELTGSDLFALDESRGITVQGVEYARLYRRNLKDIRALLFGRDEIEKTLAPFRARIEFLRGIYIRNDLKKFLDLTEERKKLNELPAFLTALSEWSKRVVSIDLSDPIEQIRFPNLTRLIHLAPLERRFSAANMREESRRFLTYLESALPKTAESKTLLSDLNHFFERDDASAFRIHSSQTPKSLPRHLFERLYEAVLNRNISFESFPAVRAYAAYVILASEIDGGGIFSEIGKLEAIILEQLAVKPKEKIVLQLIRDFRLIEKLLAAEWTSEDQKEFLRRKSELTPETLVERIAQRIQNCAEVRSRGEAGTVDGKGLSAGTGGSSLPARDARLPLAVRLFQMDHKVHRAPNGCASCLTDRPLPSERAEVASEIFLAGENRMATRHNSGFSAGNSYVDFVDLPVGKLSHWMNRALRFYEVADRRTEALLANLFSAAERERKTSAVLITGGFHTDRIRSILETRHVPYVVIAPKFQADSEPDAYRKVMTNQNADLYPVFGLRESTIAEVDFLQPPARYEFLSRFGSKQESLALKAVLGRGIETLVHEEQVPSEAAQAFYKALGRSIFSFRGRTKADLISPTSVSVRTQGMPELRFDFSPGNFRKTILSELRVKIKDPAIAKMTLKDLLRDQKFIDWTLGDQSPFTLKQKEIVKGRLLIPPGQPKIPQSEIAKKHKVRRQAVTATERSLRRGLLKRTYAKWVYSQKGPDDIVPGMVSETLYRVAKLLGVSTYSGLARFTKKRVIEAVGLRRANKVEALLHERGLAFALPRNYDEVKELLKKTPLVDLKSILPASENGSLFLVLRTKSHLNEALQDVPILDGSGTAWDGSWTWPIKRDQNEILQKNEGYVVIARFSRNLAPYGILGTRSRQPIKLALADQIFAAKFDNAEGIANLQAHLLDITPKRKGNNSQPAGQGAEPASGLRSEEGDRFKVLGGKSELNSIERPKTDNLQPKTSFPAELREIKDGASGVFSGKNQSPLPPKQKPQPTTPERLQTLSQLSFLMTKPKPMRKMATIAIKILTQVANAVKKLLANPAPMMTVNVLSMTLWIKSLLTFVKMDSFDMSDTISELFIFVNNYIYDSYIMILSILLVSEIGKWAFGGPGDSPQREGQAAEPPAELRNHLDIQKNRLSPERAIQYSWWFLSEAQAVIRQGHHIRNKGIRLDTRKLIQMFLGRVRAYTPPNEYSQVMEFLEDIYLDFDMRRWIHQEVKSGPRTVFPPQEKNIYAQALMLLALTARYHHREAMVHAHATHSSDPAFSLTRRTLNQVVTILFGSPSVHIGYDGITRVRDIEDRKLAESLIPMIVKEMGRMLFHYRKWHLTGIYSHAYYIDGERLNFPASQIYERMTKQLRTSLMPGIRVEMKRWVKANSSLVAQSWQEVVHEYEMRPSTVMDRNTILRQHFIGKLFGEYIDGDPEKMIPSLRAIWNKYFLHVERMEQFVAALSRTHLAERAVARTIRPRQSITKPQKISLDQLLTILREEFYKARGHLARVQFEIAAMERRMFEYKGHRLVSEANRYEFREAMRIELELLQRKQELETMMDAAEVFAELIHLDGKSSILDFKLERGKLREEKRLLAVSGKRLVKDSAKSQPPNAKNLNMSELRVGAEESKSVPHALFRVSVSRESRNYRTGLKFDGKDWEVIAAPLERVREEGKTGVGTLDSLFKQDQESGYASYVMIKIVGTPWQWLARITDVARRVRYIPLTAQASSQEALAVLLSLYPQIYHPSHPSIDVTFLPNASWGQGELVSQQRVTFGTSESGHPAVTIRFRDSSSIQIEEIDPTRTAELRVVQNRTPSGGEFIGVNDDVSGGSFSDPTKARTLRKGSEENRAKMPSSGLSLDSLKPPTENNYAIIKNNTRANNHSVPLPLPAELRSEKGGAEKKERSDVRSPKGGSGVEMRAGLVMMVLKLRNLFRVELNPDEQRIVASEIQFLKDKILLPDDGELAQKLDRSANSIYPGTYFGFIDSIFSFPLTVRLLVVISLAEIVSNLILHIDQSLLMIIAIIAGNFLIGFVFTFAFYLVSSMLKVGGGYSPSTKRIWISQRSSKSESTFRFSLDHELIHLLFGQANHVMNAVATLCLVQNANLLGESYIGANESMQRARKRFMAGEELFRKTQNLTTLKQDLLKQAPIIRRQERKEGRRNKPKLKLVFEFIVDLFLGLPLMTLHDLVGFVTRRSEPRNSYAYGSLLAGAVSAWTEQNELPSDAAFRFTRYAAQINSLQEVAQKTLEDFKARSDAQIPAVVPNFSELRTVLRLPVVKRGIRTQYHNPTDDFDYVVTILLSPNVDVPYSNQKVAYGVYVQRRDQMKTGRELPKQSDYQTIALLDFDDRGEIENWELRPLSPIRRAAHPWLEGFVGRELEKRRVRSFLLPSSDATAPQAKDPLKILDSEAGFKLAARWILTYANDKKFENIFDILDLLLYLSLYRRQAPDSSFLARTYGRADILQEMHAEFNAHAGTPSVNYPRVIEQGELLSPYIMGKTFLDIGAGPNIFAERVKTLHPEIKQAIGVDIERQRREPDPPGVQFILMEDPAAIPVADKFADTASLIFALHHVAVDRHKYLKEVRRKVRPGGTLLVLEDTFSHELPVEYLDPASKRESEEIERMFLGLPSDHDRLAFLHFADWFVHHFVNRSRKPLVPGHYQTMEEWARIFEEAGFVILKRRYLGFSRIGSRNPVSRGLFVLQKPETPAELRRKGSRKSEVVSHKFTAGQDGQLKTYHLPLTTDFHRAELRQLVELMGSLWVTSETKFLIMTVVVPLLIAWAVVLTFPKNVRGAFLDHALFSPLRAIYQDVPWSIRVLSEKWRRRYTTEARSAIRRLKKRISWRVQFIAVFKLTEEVLAMRRLELTRKIYEKLAGKPSPYSVSDLVEFARFIDKPALRELEQRLAILRSMLNDKKESDRELLSRRIAIRRRTEQLLAFYSNEGLRDILESMWDNPREFPGIYRSVDPQNPEDVTAWKYGYNSKRSELRRKGSRKSEVVSHKLTTGQDGQLKTYHLPLTTDFHRAELRSEGEISTIAKHVFEQLRRDANYQLIWEEAHRKGNTNPPVYTLIWEKALDEGLETYDPQERREIVNRVIDLVLADQLGFSRRKVLITASSTVALAALGFWALMRQETGIFPPDIFPVFAIYGIHMDQPSDSIKEVFQKAVSRARRKRGRPNVNLLVEQIHAKFVEDVFRTHYSLSGTDKLEHIPDVIVRLRKFLDQYRTDPVLKKKIDSERIKMGIGTKTEQDLDLEDFIAKKLADGRDDPESRFNRKVNQAAYQAGIRMFSIETGTFETDVMALIERVLRIQGNRAAAKGAWTDALNQQREFMESINLSTRLRDLALHGQLQGMFKRDPEKLSVFHRGGAHFVNHELIVGDGKKAMEVINETEPEAAKYFDPNRFSPLLSKFESQKNVFMSLMVHYAAHLARPYLGAIVDALEKELEKQTPDSLNGYLENFFRAISLESHSNVDRLDSGILNVFWKRGYLTKDQLNGLREAYQFPPELDFSGRKSPASAAPSVTALSELRRENQLKVQNAKLKVSGELLGSSLFTLHFSLPFRAELRAVIDPRESFINPDFISLQKKFFDALAAVIDDRSATLISTMVGDLITDHAWNTEQNYVEFLKMLYHFFVSNESMVQAVAAVLVPQIETQSAQQREAKFKIADYTWEPPGFNRTTIKLTTGPSNPPPTPGFQSIMRAAIAYEKANPGFFNGKVIVDAGTGHGGIGIALARLFQLGTIYGLDNNRDLKYVFETNRILNQVSPERLEFRLSDYFSGLAHLGLTGKVDGIFINPAQMPEADVSTGARSEPEGKIRYSYSDRNDGLDQIRRWLEEAQPYLKPDGIIFLQLVDRISNFDEIVAPMFRVLEYEAQEIPESVIDDPIGNSFPFQAFLDAEGRTNTRYRFFRKDSSEQMMSIQTQEALDQTVKGESVFRRFRTLLLHPAPAMPAELRQKSSNKFKVVSNKLEADQTAQLTTYHLPLTTDFQRAELRAQEQIHEAHQLSVRAAEGLRELIERGVMNAPFIHDQTGELGGLPSFPELVDFLNKDPAHNLVISFYLPGSLLNLIMTEDVPVFNAIVQTGITDIYVQRVRPQDWLNETTLGLKRILQVSVQAFVSAFQAIRKNPAWAVVSRPEEKAKPSKEDVEHGIFLANGAYLILSKELEKTPYLALDEDRERTERTVLSIIRQLETAESELKVKLRVPDRNETLRRLRNLLERARKIQKAIRERWGFLVSEAKRMIPPPDDHAKIWFQNAIEVIGENQTVTIDERSFPKAFEHDLLYVNIYDNSDATISGRVQIEPVYPWNFSFALRVSQILLVDGLKEIPLTGIPVSLLHLKTGERTVKTFKKTSDGWSRVEHQVEFNDLVPGTYRIEADAPYPASELRQKDDARVRERELKPHDSGQAAKVLEWETLAGQVIERAIKIRNEMEKGNVPQNNGYSVDQEWLIRVFLSRLKANASAEQMALFQTLYTAAGKDFSLYAESHSPAVDLFDSKIDLGFRAKILLKLAAEELKLENELTVLNDLTSAITRRRFHQMTLSALTSAATGISSEVARKTSTTVLDSEKQTAEILLPRIVSAFQTRLTGSTNLFVYYQSRNGITLIRPGVEQLNDRLYFTDDIRTYNQYLNVLRYSKIPALETDLDQWARTHAHLVATLWHEAEVEHISAHQIWGHRVFPPFGAPASWYSLEEREPTQLDKFMYKLFGDSFHQRSSFNRFRPNGRNDSLGILWERYHRGYIQPVEQWMASLPEIGSPQNNGGETTRVQSDSKDPFDRVIQSLEQQLATKEAERKKIISEGLEWLESVHGVAMRKQTEFLDDKVNVLNQEIEELQEQIELLRSLRQSAPTAESKVIVPAPAELREGFNGGRRIIDERETTGERKTNGNVSSGTSQSHTRLSQSGIWQSPRSMHQPWAMLLSAAVRTTSPEEIVARITIMLQHGFLGHKQQRILWQLMLQTVFSPGLRMSDRPRRADLFQTWGLVPPLISEGVKLAYNLLIVMSIINNNESWSEDSRKSSGVSRQLGNRLSELRTYDLPLKTFSSAEHFDSPPKANRSVRDPEQGGGEMPPRRRAELRNEPEKVFIPFDSIRSPVADQLPINARSQNGQVQIRIRDLFREIWKDRKLRDSGLFGISAFLLAGAIFLLYHIMFNTVLFVRILNGLPLSYFLVMLVLWWKTPLKKSREKLRFMQSAEQLQPLYQKIPDTSTRIGKMRYQQLESLGLLPQISLESHKWAVPFESDEERAVREWVLKTALFLAGKDRHSPERMWELVRNIDVIRYSFAGDHFRREFRWKLATMILFAVSAFLCLLAVSFFYVVIPIAYIKARWIVFVVGMGFAFAFGVAAIGATKEARQALHKKRKWALSNLPSEAGKDSIYIYRVITGDWRLDRFQARRRKKRRLINTTVWGTAALIRRRQDAGSQIRLQNVVNHYLLGIVPKKPKVLLGINSYWHLGFGALAVLGYLDGSIEEPQFRLMFQEGFQTLMQSEKEESAYDDFLQGALAVVYEEFGVAASDRLLLALFDDREGYDGVFRVLRELKEQYAAAHAGEPQIKSGEDFRKALEQKIGDMRRQNHRYAKNARYIAYLSLETVLNVIGGRWDRFPGRLKAINEMTAEYSRDSNRLPLTLGGRELVVALALSSKRDGSEEALKQWMKESLIPSVSLLEQLSGKRYGFRHVGGETTEKLIAHDPKQRGRAGLANATRDLTAMSTEVKRSGRSDQGDFELNPYPGTYLSFILLLRAWDKMEILNLAYGYHTSIDVELGNEGLRFFGPTFFAGYPSNGKVQIPLLSKPGSGAMGFPGLANLDEGFTVDVDTGAIKGKQINIYQRPLGIRRNDTGEMLRLYPQDIERTFFLVQGAGLYSKQSHLTDAALEELMVKRYQEFVEELNSFYREKLGLSEREIKYVTGEGYSGERHPYPDDEIHGRIRLLREKKIGEHLGELNRIFDSYVGDFKRFLYPENSLQRELVKMVEEGTLAVDGVVPYLKSLKDRGNPEADTLLALVFPTRSELRSRIGEFANSEALQAEMDRLEAPLVFDEKSQSWLVKEGQEGWPRILQGIEQRKKVAIPFQYFRELGRKRELPEKLLVNQTLQAAYDRLDAEYEFVEASLRFKEKQKTIILQFQARQLILVEVKLDEQQTEQQPDSNQPIVIHGYYVPRPRNIEDGRVVVENGQSGTAARGLSGRVMERNGEPVSPSLLELIELNELADPEAFVHLRKEWSDGARALETFLRNLKEHRWLLILVYSANSHNEETAIPEPSADLSRLTRFHEELVRDFDLLLMNFPLPRIFRAVSFRMIPGETMYRPSPLWELVWREYFRFRLKEVIFKRQKHEQTVRNLLAQVSQEDQMSEEDFKQAQRPLIEFFEHQGWPIHQTIHAVIFDPNPRLYHSIFYDLLRELLPKDQTGSAVEPREEPSSVSMVRKGKEPDFLAQVRAKKPELARTIELLLNSPEIQKSRRARVLTKYLRVDELGRIRLELPWWRRSWLTGAFFFVSGLLGALLGILSQKPIGIPLPAVFTISAYIINRIFHIFPKVDSSIVDLTPENLVKLLMLENVNNLLPWELFHLASRARQHSWEETYTVKEHQVQVAKPVKPKAARKTRSRPKAEKAKAKARKEEEIPDTQAKADIPQTDIAKEAAAPEAANVVAAPAHDEVSGAKAELSPVRRGDVEQARAALHELNAALMAKNGQVDFEWLERTLGPEHLTDSLLVLLWREVHDVLKDLKGENAVRVSEKVSPRQEREFFDRLSARIEVLKDRQPSEVEIIQDQPVSESGGIVDEGKGDKLPSRELAEPDAAAELRAVAVEDLVQELEGLLTLPMLERIVFRGSNRASFWFEISKSSTANKLSAAHAQAEAFVGRIKQLRSFDRASTYLTSIDNTALTVEEQLSYAPERFKREIIQLISNQFRDVFNPDDLDIKTESDPSQPHKIRISLISDVHPKEKWKRALGDLEFFLTRRGAFYDYVGTEMVSYLTSDPERRKYVLTLELKNPSEWWLILADEAASKRRILQALKQKYGVADSGIAVLPREHDEPLILSEPAASQGEIAETVLGRLAGGEGKPRFVVVPIRFLPLPVVHLLKQIRLHSTMSGQKMSVYDYLKENVGEIIFAPYRFRISGREDYTHGDLSQTGNVFFTREGQALDESYLNQFPERKGKRVIYIGAGELVEWNGTPIFHESQLDNFRIRLWNASEQIQQIIGATAALETVKLISGGKLSPEYFEGDHFLWLDKISFTVVLYALDPIRRAWEIVKPESLVPLSADRPDPLLREFTQYHNQLTDQITRLNSQLGLPWHDQGFDHLQSPPAELRRENQLKVQNAKLKVSEKSPSSSLFTSHFSLPFRAELWMRFGAAEVFAEGIVRIPDLIMATGLSSQLIRAQLRSWIHSSRRDIRPSISESLRLRLKEIYNSEEITTPIRGTRIEVISKLPQASDLLFTDLSFIHTSPDFRVMYLADVSQDEVDQFLRQIQSLYESMFGRDFDRDGQFIVLPITNRERLGDQVNRKITEALRRGKVELIIDSEPAAELDEEISWQSGASLIRITNDLTSESDRLALRAWGNTLFALEDEFHQLAAKREVFQASVLIQIAEFLYLKEQFRQLVGQAA